SSILWVVGGMLSGRFRARENCGERAISTPLAKVIVKVDLVEAGTGKFGESSVDIVLSEIGGGIERAAETLTGLCERESAVFVDIAAGSLSVLDDVRTRDVMIVEDFAQSLAIVVLEPSRDWRDTRIARLLGSDGVGDTLGDEH